MSNLMNTYNRLDVSFTHGDGVYLYDKKDNKYLDSLCGVAVTSIGHNHPQITSAIKKQATKLLHTSNIYGIKNQKKLAKKLCELSGLDKVFFGNSGTEAVEAAIKLVRLKAYDEKIKNPQIIVMDNSFHGRTMGALSATGNDKIKEGFAPLLEGFMRVPFDDIKAIKKQLKNNKNIVAIMVEPVQGEGGIQIPADDYLNNLRQICDENNLLLILDEVQTGMGRCGSWFCYQQYDIQPDILILAKALGNGVPIGAIVTNKKTSRFFSPGKHGSTFGGNPLATYVARAVIKTIEEDNILAKVKVICSMFKDKLSKKIAPLKAVKEIRIKGLMIGIEIKTDKKEKLNSIVKDAIIEHKLLINLTHTNVIRLLPPFLLNESHIDEIIKILIKLIKKL
ncbi:MAG: aspartate aminotransferase family protein [Gammaproteobacteria bacterium]|nr:MAG: aspartate aminotransferase family protein [Gammaproteobacteria bacterium]